MSKAKKTKKKKTELFDENDIEEVEPIKVEEGGLSNIAWQWQQWEDELAGKKKPEQKKKVKLF